MIVNVSQLNKKAIVGTTTSNKMQLSGNAASLIFNMFINNKYSNPIGSIVREITSNCFDSHIEAGVDKPILIKKTFDEETNHYHLSFIDFGVGMSPERIEKVYCTFFESTKRDNNTQIGGYGIGSKSILAYKRKVGYGTDEYDNSFFIITNYNGVKYYYCVYEGDSSPEINLMYSEPTDEPNGTEVRIPVLKSDIDRFETEIIRQLYYFDNVVFEGFTNSKITNEYQILNTNTFQFRGYELGSYAHVCLGKVAYKIDYSILDLNSQDYQFPVAIKFNIGDLSVNDSRENLDYSEATIKLLKQKLKDLKTEFTDLLSKQCDNIVTLEDYFRNTQNKLHLKLTDDHTINLNFMSEDVKINYKNFKYNHLTHIPSEDNLFSLFFNYTAMGNKETRQDIRRGRGFNRTYHAISTSSNLYYLEEEYKRNYLKMGYIKSIHPRYYLLRKNVEINILAVQKLFKNTSYTLNDIDDLLNDYWEIIKSHSTDYNTIEIPEEFKLSRKRAARIDGEMVVHFAYDGSSLETCKAKISDIIDFNGTIFYGTKDQVNKLHRAVGVMRNILKKGVITSCYGRNFNNSNSSKSRLMFVMVAKTNTKYFADCKKAIDIDYFKEKMLYRYDENLKEIYSTYKLFESIEKVINSKFYINGGFVELYPKLKPVIDLCETLVKENKNISDYYVTKYLKDEILVGYKEHLDKKEQIDVIIGVYNYFQQYQRYLDVPYYADNSSHPKFFELLKLIGDNCPLLK